MPALIEGVDFYYEGPFMVFTEKFLRERGYCCESGCRHCPYGFRKDQRSRHALGRSYGGLIDVAEIRVQRVEQRRQIGLNNHPHARKIDTLVVMNEHVTKPDRFAPGERPAMRRASRPKLDSRLRLRRSNIGSRRAASCDR